MKRDARKLQRWPLGRQSEVAVSEESGVRFLHIGGDAIQSAVRLSAPDRLELHYNRAMMSFLLFHSDPRRVLMIGLGGGSMARFLHRSYPRCQVTAVEVNADVVAAARRYFDLPADGPRFSTVLDDGAAWVAAHPDSADVLLLDAFDDGRQVQALCSLDFYTRAFEALSGQGVMVQNFMSDDDRIDIYSERIEQAFDRRVVLVKVADRVNTIVLAFKGGPRCTTFKTLKGRAQTLTEQYGLPGNHYLNTLRRLSASSGGRTDTFNY